MSYRVVVCHAAKQHSHQFAKGLYDNGLLELYITGSPALKKQVDLGALFGIKKNIRVIDEMSSNIMEAGNI